MTACLLVLVGIPVALYLPSESPRPGKLGIPIWGLLNRLYAGYSRAESEKRQHHWFQASEPLTCQAGQHPETLEGTNEATASLIRSCATLASGMVCSPQNCTQWNLAAWQDRR